MLSIQLITLSYPVLIEIAFHDFAKPYSSWNAGCLKWISRKTKPKFSNVAIFGRNCLAYPLKTKIFLLLVSKFNLTNT